MLRINFQLILLAFLPITFVSRIEAQSAPKYLYDNETKYTVDQIFVDNFNDGTAWSFFGKKGSMLRKGKLELSDKRNYEFHTHQRFNFYQLRNFELCLRFKTQELRNILTTIENSIEISSKDNFKLKIDNKKSDFSFKKTSELRAFDDFSFTKIDAETYVNLKIRKIGLNYTVYIDDQPIFKGLAKKEGLSNEPQDVGFKIKALSMTIDQFYLIELTKSEDGPKPEYKTHPSKSTPNSLAEFEKKEKKYYALIIGNNNYQDPDLTDLDNPIKDANSLYKVLTEKYTFETSNVILLSDATREDIIQQLDVLSTKLTEQDNLIIFYAGHGHWNKDKENGYWLPVDAKQNVTTNWFRNSTMQEYIGDLDAKHVLLIADACFGGGIFKTRAAFSDAERSINNLYRYESRKAMTSGMLNEVPDRSVFMENLIERLENNEEKYLSSATLFFQFRENVMNNSNNAPQFGTIHNTGDKGGDFVFILKE